MGRWSIERERPVGPSAGRDTESCLAFTLRSDGQQRQTTVEYAAGGNGVLPILPRDALRPYLDHTLPPRRLIVDRTGNVSAADDREDE